MQQQMIVSLCYMKKEMLICFLLSLVVVDNCINVGKGGLFKEDMTEGQISCWSVE